MPGASSAAVGGHDSGGSEAGRRLAQCASRTTRQTSGCAPVHARVIGRAIERSVCGGHGTRKGVTQSHHHHGRVVIVPRRAMG